MGAPQCVPTRPYPIARLAEVGSILWSLFFSWFVPGIYLMILPREKVDPALSGAN